MFRELLRKKKQLTDADQKPETPAKRSLMDRINSFMR